MIELNQARANYIFNLGLRTIDDLLDDLQRSTLSNQYGSHDDQISLVRGEIARRAQR